MTINWKSSSTPSSSRWGTFPKIFLTTAWAGSGMETYLYRPLTTLSYSLNHLIFGLEPGGFHLVNVLLHGVASVLVFRVGRVWGLSNAAAGIGRPPLRRPSGSCGGGRGRVRKERLLSRGLHHGHDPLAWRGR